MTVQRLFVLRFANGKHLAYGVPEFLGDEEGEDFLAYAQNELVEGAAHYEASCCRPLKRRPDGTLVDDGGADGRSNRSRPLMFSREPSARVQELQVYANQLRDMGQRSQARRDVDERELHGRDGAKPRGSMKKQGG